jgi:hypothetical protein
LKTSVATISRTHSFVEHIEHGIDQVEDSQIYK